MNKEALRIICRYLKNKDCYGNFVQHYKDADGSSYWKAFHNKCDTKLKISDMSSLISGGFDWDKSPEGYFFWNDIYNEICKYEKSISISTRLV